MSPSPALYTPTISFTRGRAFKTILRKKNLHKINVGIYLIKHANETYIYVITKPLYTLYIIEKNSRKINSRKKNARKRNGGCIFFHSLFRISIDWFCLYSRPYFVEVSISRVMNAFTKSCMHGSVSHFVICLISYLSNYNYYMRNRP